MTKYTVPKSRSEENLPLLDSEEMVQSKFRNHFVTRSCTDDVKTEWEILLLNDSHSSRKSEAIESHDFAELNNCQAIIHILKASIGTGILALPSALRYSGLLLGSLSILILSLVSIYSMKLLLRVVAQIRLADSRPIYNLDYEKTVKLCFENSNERFRRFYWLHHVLYVSLAIAQIGFLSSYHIFVAENTKMLIDHYVPTFSLWIYQVAFIFLLLPLLFIKTLNKLAYFTQLANILVLVSLLISLVYCLQDPLPIRSLDLIKLSDATPLFFGIVIFSFESINVINPIESHLKKKKEILNTCGVLNIATSIVLITYLIIGICGYWKFGDNVSSSLILSMPLSPWYYMLCKPFYIVSILISYALQGYVMFSVVWKKLQWKLRSDKSRQIGAVGVRFGIVFCTTILSIAIPHFDLFISLVGAFSGSAITLLFPAICSSVSVYSNKDDSKYWRVQLSINAIIFGIGLFGCVIGTYSSIANIIKAFSV